MTGKYAYSFDQEDYRGSYTTRDEALSAALTALRDRSDMPEGVFVGQWAEPNVHADGHAEVLIEAMRDRWNQEQDDRSFLAKVNAVQTADLDRQIAAAVRMWLGRNSLAPKPTEVHAVSHHPVPTVDQVPQSSDEPETSVIGEA